MTATPFNEQSDTTDVAVLGDTAHIDIWYPDQRPIKFIEIGLMAVRAADGIRVHYDFDRDGFVVCQPKPVIERIGAAIEIGAEWIEVGFFQSWVFNDWENGFPPDAAIEEFKAKQMAR